MPLTSSLTVSLYTEAWWPIPLSSDVHSVCCSHIQLKRKRLLMTLRKLLFGAILLGLCAAVLAQEASITPAAITPNDALILENIPAIPASIAARADRYTQYRSASMWSWHPQRREILVG